MAVELPPPRGSLGGGALGGGGAAGAERPRQRRSLELPDTLRVSLRPPPEALPEALTQQLSLHEPESATATAELRAAELADTLKLPAAGAGGGAPAAGGEAAPRARAGSAEAGGAEASSRRSAPPRRPPPPHTLPPLPSTRPLPAPPCPAA